MPRSLELEIRDHLVSGEPVQKFLTSVIDSLLDGLLSVDDRATVFRFMFNAGLDEEATKIFIELVKNKQKVPFGILVETMARQKIKPSKIFLEALFKGVRRQDGQENLSASFSWDNIDERFNESRNKTRIAILEKYRRQKEILLEKLSYLRTQRMIEEEERVLKLLLRLYPDDQALRKEGESFKERWARDVIGRRSSSISEQIKIERTETALTLEEKKFAQILTDELLRLVKEEPTRSYDFSIGLYFMELYTQALEIIRHSPREIASDWLRVELLLMGRRFVDALEEIGHLEIKYSDDPETTFSSSYTRAKALRGLGQTQPAIELMKSIVNVRPNYRSASSLLLDWSGGTF